MRIYLDTCCLNRPFDDQSQDRVRSEAAAVSEILNAVRRGERSLYNGNPTLEELTQRLSEFRRRRKPGERDEAA